MEPILRATASAVMLEGLATEGRRILSDWRGLLLVRQATFRLPPSQRRWAKLPVTTQDLAPIFRQMRARGEITPISGVRALYEVTVPYARLGFVDEREALFELNPYCVLSHASALVFHGLTEQLPKQITATMSRDKTGDLLPLDTEPSDWEGVALPPARTPTTALGTPLVWIRTMPARFFGFSSYQPAGFSIRVTTLERTLIDALQMPEACGGIDNVLMAWGFAKENLDLNRLIGYVDRLDIALLKQRAGFLLEELGLSHERFEIWSRHSHRGGSSKLDGAAPFAPQFSERWNLSLNAPVDLVHEAT
jgi:predicted transcriptional regulator of viral defense system